MSEEKPTIEQRLEAVVHTLELVSAMQLKTEKEIKRLGRFLRVMAVDHEARLLALEGDGEES